MVELTLSLGMLQYVEISLSAYLMCKCYELYISLCDIT